MKMELLKWSCYQEKRSAKDKKNCAELSVKLFVFSTSEFVEEKKENHKSNRMNNLTAKVLLLFIVFVFYQQDR